MESGQYFYATYVAGEEPRTISSTIVNNGYADMSSKTLNTVRLMGAGLVTSVTVNGSPHSDFESSASGETTIRNLNLQPNLPFTIVYSNA